MKSISTNFRFKPNFHLRIKEAADASGMSLTAWVVAACLDRLRENDDAPKPTNEKARLTFTSRPDPRLGQIPPPSH
jgi:hypothetical protein